MRPNVHYFALDSTDLLYGPMLKAQSICIYAPSGMPGLEMQLIGVVS